MTRWEGYTRDGWNARISAARLKVTIDRQRGVETPAWIRELAARPRPGLEQPEQPGSAA